ncbi:hypothetical protein GCM10011497_33600 [Elstera cyanobacteriorum]|uniref:Uncharacterized protein n=1 Tax=Elstera cyanobacteriorum TaxID=2022747 RepID=A0A255XX13_9PROT|nr:hypothetical protein [Elstera cyanobacteriorum]OYQ21539.1 hypothetical protein CHR90_01390 [Elstera cyanobacteriorum]GGA00286.1 hypothetical protein GCM10011497_33600 [Elstera cyanobacteriorum]
MAIDLSDFEAFGDALRRTTGTLLIVEEALSRSAVLTGGLWGQSTEESGAEGFQPAVFRSTGPGLRAGQSAPYGAGVTPVAAPLIAAALPVLEFLGVLSQIVGYLQKTVGVVGSVAQTSANFETVLERLRNQFGASGAEIEKFRDAAIKNAKDLQQTPSAYAEVFSKIGTLDLDKDKQGEDVKKGALSERPNAAKVSTAVAQIATVRNLPAGDLAEVVTPLLTPVQNNMRAVNRRLAQLYAVYADAPLPDAMMKTSFAPLVNRVQEFGASEAQAIGSAATLLDFAKKRANDPAQAVKATEELFAQLNDADVRARFQAKGIDIAGLRQKATQAGKDPVLVIAEAIEDNRRFNKNDLDFELKSVLKEKQSAVLLADLVKDTKKFRDDSQEKTNQTDAHSYLEAFKARQTSALGTYTAGKVALEAGQMDIGRKAMGGLGSVQGAIGEGARETPDILDKFFESLGKSRMPLEGQTIPWHLMTPMAYPVERFRAPTSNEPTLQEAGFRYGREQNLSPPTPVKTELTIHLTGLQPGMSATVMSDSEKFMTKVYSGYGVYNL